MTLSEIELFIANRALESSALEFKDGAALSRENKKPAEMIKDISAMANGAGGIIIYGISEEGERNSRFAGNISPIVDASITADWIAQVVASRTAPPVQGVEIETIEVPNRGRIFVVNVPQGSTAHQSGFDLIYYQRIGTQALGMSDFQVRDVMNRRSAPVLKIRMHIAGEDLPDEARRYHIVPIIENIGNISIEKWKFRMLLPQHAIAPTTSNLTLQYANKRVSYDQFKEGANYFQRVTFDSRRVSDVGFGDLHPGETFVLYDTTNFPPMYLKVDDKVFDNFQKLDSSIAWMFYSTDAVPIKGSMSFLEWCDF